MLKLKGKYFVIALRLLLGAVFVASSLGKMIDGAAFRQDLGQLIGFDPRLAEIVGIVLPAVELTLGLLLLSGLFLKWVTLLASGFLLLFIIVFLPLAGSTTSCGCFGALSGDETVGTAFFVRDLLLLTVSFFLYTRAGNAGVSRRFFQWKAKKVS